MSEVPASSALLQPISSGERVQYIDVLRGFALYGVLLANIIWTAHDVVLTPSAARHLPTHTIDRVVKYLVVFFVDGKFITLFSFLFAIGFTIQMQRALRRGVSGTPIYARRTAVLMIIGVVHIVLVWFGDILFAYGLLGFALMSLRKWRPGPSMLVVACLLILFSRAAFVTVQNAATDGRPPPTAAAHPSEQTQQETLAAFQAGYTSVVRKNVSIYWNDLFGAGIIVALLAEVFGRFLLGLYVGRRGYIYEIENWLPRLRRALPWLVLVGVLGNGTAVAFEWAAEMFGPSASSVWSNALRPLIAAGVLCLAASYAIGIALLLRSTSWAPVLNRLAPVGRMALTNYLTHSLVFLLVLTGAGLGLIGHIGAAMCFAITIILFGLQIVFSNWWLGHFRFGPVEWIWRSLTYGEMQSMRIDRQPGSAAV